MYAYILSIIAAALFMAHFWWAAPVWYALWPITGFCAIGSIYSGIISRAAATDNGKKAMATTAAVIGCLVLLGLTVSAVFIFVPYKMAGM